jgi:HPt (histidine-containing phosphotransfer) domain-containing protein
MPPPSDIFDRHALLYRLFGDVELMDEVIRTFLHDLPTRLVSIKAAIDAGNAEALRAAAHTLKGAAGNVSATRVSEAARVIEHLAAASQTTAVEVAWHKLSSEASKFVTIMEERTSIAAAATPRVSQEA